MTAALLAAALAALSLGAYATSAGRATVKSRAAQSRDSAQTLRPGRPVDSAMKKAGESHFYKVKLSSGELLRVTIEPREIALLAVVVNGPDGAKLDEFELETEAPEPEPVALVAEVSGTYTLEVSARGEVMAAASYRIEVEKPRTADARDRNRIAAERASAKGSRLQFARGDAQSVRDAIVKYEEALSLWRATGDRDREAGALGSIGNAYGSLRENQRAVEYYRKQLDLAREARNRFQESVVLETMGWLYYNGLRDKRNALDMLGQALPLCRALGRRDAEARVLTAIGKVYTDLGETPDEKRKAIEHHTAAMSIFRSEKNPYYEGEALGNLMMTWKALGVPRTAIVFGKQAVNTFQGIRSNIKNLEKDTQQTFIKSKEATYRTLADLLTVENRLPEAMQVLTMLKEEEYFEFIRRDGDDSSSLTRRAALSPAEIEWEDRFRASADTLTTRGRERGELIKKASQRTAADEQRLIEVDKDFVLANEAFEKFLERLSKELASAPAGSEKLYQLKETLGLREDLRDLGSGSVALYTLVGEEYYRVILIGPDVLRAFEYKISAADLALKVTAFREALEDHESDPLPLAKELFTILVGPMAKELKDAHAETLMWSLDGVLRYMPVSALHDGEKYLVEQYRNAAFTPASLTRLKEKPSEKWRGLGFGVSKSHHGLRALPAVPGELRGIINDADAAEGAAATGVLPGKVYLDDTFTEDTMKALLLQRYPVVHVASHFIFEPGDEANSYLLLGDGNRLSLKQIKTSLSFGGAELLTLSACDTAKGGVGADGKEVEGFAMLAQRSGAKAVVASLWSVADDSTSLLMRNFYRIRDAQPGLPKAEALKQAQLALLNGETTDSATVARRGIGFKVGKAPPALSFRHPYYWAPFTLIGNWR